MPNTNFRIFWTKNAQNPHYIAPLNVCHVIFNQHWCFSPFRQAREVEHLEGVVASLKQELGMAKKRVSELQHALEDDMHYDSDGLTNDEDDEDDDIVLGLSDDSDDDLKDSDSRPSEPRSYRSFDELDDDYDISDRLKRKLNDLTDSDSIPRSARGSRPPADSVGSDVFENATSPHRTSGDDDSRKGSRRPRSGTDEHDPSADKRRRKSDDKRRKSVEKKRSFEKRSTDNSIH